MYYVYLLKSKKDRGVYIGFYPADLKKRIVKHHLGLVRSTKNRRPLELVYLVYYEAYKSKQDALIREKRLKRFAKGFASLRSRLKFSLTEEG